MLRTCWKKSRLFPCGTPSAHSSSCDECLSCSSICECPSVCLSLSLPPSFSIFCVSLWLSLSLSVCLPVCLPACLPACLPVCMSLLFLSLSACFSICLSFSLCPLSACLSLSVPSLPVLLTLSLSLCLFGHSFIYLSIYWLTYSSVHLFCNIAFQFNTFVDSLFSWYLLVGLVVKASTLRAENPGFEFRLRRDFSWSSHTGDLKKIGTPVDTLPGAWAITGTGWSGVNIL